MPHVFAPIMRLRIIRIATRGCAGVEFPHRSRSASHANATMKPSFTTVAHPTRRRALARAWTGVAVMRRVGVRGIAGALGSILH
jgi:hypothetical protein